MKGAESLTVAAVVVDYRADDALATCVDSLLAEGLGEIVVVDNEGRGGARRALGPRDVRVVEPGINLGYGRGVNRGVAEASPSDLLVVSNPDVVVHPGALGPMVQRFSREDDLGILGPTILTPTGETYPSVRVFPSALLAAAHAAFAPLWPGNPFTRRYRSPGRGGRVDWVSGAFMMVRRDLFERLGGFDEGYFMFAEDMDLCWRARELGARSDVCPEAVITHLEGVSRRHRPRAMLLAHHRGAMRFEWRTAKGVRKVLAPVAVAMLALRLVLAVAAPSRRP